MSATKESSEAADRKFVVVASRLPVDRVEGPDGRLATTTNSRSAASVGSFVEDIG